MNQTNNSFTYSEKVLFIRFDNNLVTVLNPTHMDIYEYEPAFES